MKVVYYYRYPAPGVYSIERLFGDIQNAMPPEVQSTTAISRFPSHGFWRRGYNCLEAIFKQGDVNHITGDVILFLKEK